MIPSTLYNEDTNAKVTLNNGTELHYTAKAGDMYPLNTDADLSISYTTWANEPIMKKANRGFHQWQNGVVVANDLGACQSPNYNYLKAAGITQLLDGQPRFDDLTANVVLINGGGLFAWAKNAEFSGNRINSGSGADRRFLLNMDINKMLFTCTVDVVDKEFFDNIDWVTNGEGIPVPQSHAITLGELYNHPEKYYCTGTISLSNAMIYGETGNNHWVGANVRPALLLKSSGTGELLGVEGAFGTFYNNNGELSYDSRNIANHPVFGGGGNSPSVCYNMSNGYFLGCGDTVTVTPDETYDAIGQQAVSLGLAKYGGATTWNKLVYVKGKMIDYGARVIWFAYGCRVYNNANSNVYYRQLNWSQRCYVKAEKMLSFIASFGLYFMKENFNPNDANLTPETLGTDNRIMLGEMYADGTTSGNWITDIESYNGINKNGKTVNPKFNPSGGGGGGNITDKEQNVDLITQGGNAGFVHFIEINTASTATANQISDALSAFDITTIGKDLLRNLISYKVFACLKTTGGLLRAINIDGHQLELNGNVLRGNYISQGDVANVDLGTIVIPRTYYDFRDFAPYTKIEMYVPFCGWFDLPSWCMGKTITGTMWVDLANGTCKAVIKASKTPVAEVGGTVSYDIPFIANATGAKTGAVISSAIATAAAGVGAVTAPSFASITGTIAAGANLASALNANTTTMRGVLGDGSNTNGIADVWVKVTGVDSPDNDKEVPEIYKHQHGVPCGKSLTLATGDGYTQILDANITGAMTDREKQMIIDGFRHGLIL